MVIRELSIRRARDSDAAHLDVRRAAFAPGFASFRALLGEEISQVTQIRDDQEQAEYLSSLFEPDSGWELYVAEQAGVVVGFVSVQLNAQTFVGEIGLNAVHPDHAGAGIGTKMYDVVLTDASGGHARGDGVHGWRRQPRTGPPCLPEGWLHDRHPEHLAVPSAVGLFRASARWPSILRAQKLA
jgi:GNAT superfamily N-acetyltransferase